jgi:hypothetical protein
MKTFLMSLALALTLNNAEASFNRFWIGHKLDTISTEQFLDGLNKRLLPDLIKLAAGKGLVSYSPYVSTMNTKDLPAEIALITYESEDIYKKVRGTPEGDAYSNLHWELFNKEISKSTVPVQFQNELVEGNAYELNAKFEGWKKGETYLTIYRRGNEDLKTLATAFGKLKDEKSLNNSIMLITKNYIFEYRSYKVTTKVSTLPLSVVNMTQLKKSPVGKSLGFNEGINAQF